MTAADASVFSFCRSVFPLKKVKRETATQRRRTKQSGKERIFPRNDRRMVWNAQRFKLKLRYDSSAKICRRPGFQKRAFRRKTEKGGVFSGTGAGKRKATTAMLRRDCVTPRFDSNEKRRQSEKRERSCPKALRFAPASAFECHEEKTSLRLRCGPACPRPSDHTWWWNRKTRIPELLHSPAS